MIDTMTARTGNEDLLDLVPDNATPDLRSPRQRELMASLVEQLRQLDPELANQAEQYEARMAGKWTPGRNGNASRWIDRLIAKVRELRKARPVVEIEDGMYILDGVIYKVQHAVHGSGSQYAKRLVAGAPGERATFVYAPGVVRKLRPEHRMTMDQAREFGALYGTCCQCGRVLTNEDSIEAGIGPICASKL
jgi:hypothetical protein